MPPPPNTGACPHQTPLPDLRKRDLNFDGFDQRPLRHLLGTKAMWREVVGANGSYELREPLTSYEDDFGPKNVDLRLENAFYWDISF
jgi:hypothetical protein